MQPEKKQLEVLIINYFRESYKYFPKGKIVSGESPDFTIKMKNYHVLGIELTRLNPGNAEVLNENEITENNFREQIVVKSKSLFEQRSALKLFVKFLFSGEHKIQPENELMVVVQTVNAIRKAIQNRNENSFFKISISRDQLPQGLEEILVVHDPGMVSSIWELSNNLGISTDVVDDLKKTIYKKDEKLRLYQKNHLNYYWLLITTDRLRSTKSFNLSNKIMNQKFESRFQQVFLFDLIKSDIYRLI
jgi:hypothetical protein